MTGRGTFVAGYVTLLAASFLVRGTLPDPPPPLAGQAVLVLDARSGEAARPGRVSLAFRDTSSRLGSAAPVILMLHGSPGAGDDFRSMAPELAAHARVLVPDLPGFGRSSHRIPDYSIRSHAAYVLDLLRHLGINRAHVVGFSMGSGVALEMTDLDQTRIASLTLLSGIGVQEMELLGDYRANHALHGLQLAAIWTLAEALPHFGALDAAMLNVPYARNFSDSDQRPLRGILGRVEVPTLVIHGRHDPLVPYEAATEHHRLVPQSELHTEESSHFMVFEEGPRLARLVGAFVDRVERGQAPTRARAEPSRLAAAVAPFDPAHLPRFKGVAALTVSALLASATLVSEDLASVAAGVLVAERRLTFAAAVLACFVGILAGDLFLFAAGRLLGRRLLTLPGLSWLVAPGALARSSAWLDRRGAVVVLASRVVPGTRLPIALAAGLLDTRAWRMTLWFALACAVWTPAIVGVAALLARPMHTGPVPGGAFVAHVAVTLLATVVLLRLGVSLVTHRGRRLLLSTWRRVTRWEFWPPWVFYPPLLARIAVLMVRHRGMTVFTAANPSIPAGGFLGESKLDILQGLARAGEFVAASTRIDAGATLPNRIDRVRAFMVAQRLTYPIVLKPDQGQRGAGVSIVRDEATATEYLRRAVGDVIAQEYVPGEEFGVFYHRRPSETRGHVFSVTEKRLVSVVGDGRRTLERLILDDDRAVCMARFFLRRHAAHLDEIPAAGDPVQLVEVGTHCRGALFLDGSHLLTPALESAIDAVARTFDGFYFGRFDIRVPDRAAFRRGERFKVVELNGVTSEATHIYDPRIGLGEAYRTLAEQWRLAFEIGDENRRLGVQPVDVLDLLRRVRDYDRVAAGHVDLGVTRAAPPAAGVAVGAAEAPEQQRT